MVTKRRYTITESLPIVTKRLYTITESFHALISWGSFIQDDCKARMNTK